MTSMLMNNGREGVCNFANFVTISVGLSLIMRVFKLFIKSWFICIFLLFKCPNISRGKVGLMISYISMQGFEERCFYIKSFFLCSGLGGWVNNRKYIRSFILLQRSPISTIKLIANKKIKNSQTSSPITR